jgi:hypothetical protein
MPPEWRGVIISFRSVVYKDLFDTKAPGHTSGTRGDTPTRTIVLSFRQTSNLQCTKLKVFERQTNNDRNKIQRRQFQFTSDVKLTALNIQRIPEMSTSPSPPKQTNKQTNKQSLVHQHFIA